jgi:hypothetical protein
MNCPHCDIPIMIEEINCGIFRCGIVKETGLQLPSHLPEIECKKLIPYIWGCSKPFMLVKGKLIKCEYI